MKKISIILAMLFCSCTISKKTLEQFCTNYNAAIDKLAIHWECQDKAGLYDFLTPVILPCAQRLPYGMLCKVIANTLLNAGAKDTAASGKCNLNKVENDFSKISGACNYL